MSFFDEMKQLFMSKMSQSNYSRNEGSYDMIMKMIMGALSSNGIQSIIQKLSQSGLKDKVDSWIRQGKNEELTDDEVSMALGPDIINDMSNKTGLSKQDVTHSLATMLPEMIDKNTPDGKLDQHTVEKNTKDIDLGDVMNQFKGLFG